MTQKKLPLLDNCLFFLFSRHCDFMHHHASFTLHVFIKSKNYFEEEFYLYSCLYGFIINLPPCFLILKANKPKYLHPCKLFWIKIRFQKSFSLILFHPFCLSFNPSKIWLYFSSFLDSVHSLGYFPFFPLHWNCPAKLPIVFLVVFPNQARIQHDLLFCLQGPPPSTPSAWVLPFLLLIPSNPSPPPLPLVPPPLFSQLCACSYLQAS
jgi:hypothetical protein